MNPELSRRRFIKAVIASSVAAASTSGYRSALAQDASAAGVGRGVGGSLRTAYWRTRDRLLVAFPAVRRLKRLVTG